MTSPLPGSVGMIYGALRSGTTLLRIMVNNHPGLTCIGETDFLFDFLERRNGVWSYDREALSRHRIFRASGLELRPGLDGTALLADLIAQIGTRGSGLPVLVAHRGLGKIAELLPDLRVVHLLRDPRDVAKSSIGMGWASTTYFGVDHWIATERSFRDGKTGLVRPPVDIRYEDLITDPPGELARLCTAFGTDYDPAMLEFPADSTYSPPDPKLILQWKTRQSVHEVQLTEARLGPALEAAGYAPSGYPALSMGPVARARLALSNRIDNFALSVRRYGLRDAIQSRVARYLGLRQALYDARARMDRVDIARLK